MCLALDSLRPKFRTPLLEGIVYLRIAVSHLTTMTFMRVKSLCDIRETQRLGTYVLFLSRTFLLFNLQRRRSNLLLGSACD